VVTTSVDGQPYGLAVNAFSSISLDPPLVLVCVAETSATYTRLFLGDHLAVNVLSHQQRALATRFAQSGGDKFAGVQWHPSVGGSPVLAEVSAYLELEIDKRVRAYTHTIFVGRVVEAETYGIPPLIYLSGALFDGSVLREAT